MRLRDRLGVALQAFREVPDLRAQLDAAADKLKHANQALKRANQALEQSSYECFLLHDEMEEKDSRMRFLDAKSNALLAALTEFSPKLSSTDEMKHFYDTVAYSLDPDGFTLYRMAQELTGMEVAGLFSYEDARGMFEEASGHTLMDYLTAAYFDAVEWEIIPGSTYERAELGEVDTSAPEYRQFERQLYEKVLERMGFGNLLVPERPQQTIEEIQAVQNAPVMAGI